MARDNEEAVEKLIAHLKEPPETPRLLYKYVIPERIDVLQHARIRYTHLGGTNDVFEIRRTIKTMFGPRMESALRDSLDSKSIDELMVEALVTHTGLTSQAAQEMYALHRNTAEMQSVRLRAMAELDYQLGSVLPAALGDPSFIIGLLTDFAGKTAALSVSEDQHSVIMWAHYAANWTGFVISFHTTHPSLGPSPSTGSMFFPISYRMKW